MERGGRGGKRGKEGGREGGEDNVIGYPSACRMTSTALARIVFQT